MQLNKETLEKDPCNFCGKTLREQMKGCNEITCYRQFLHKQETLEESAERHCLINSIPTDQMIVKYDRSCEFETPVTMFVQGIKHQQEQDKNKYSEEEVDTLLEMLKRSIAEIKHIKHTYKDRGHCVKYLSDCESAIEQFKKK